MDTIVLVTSPLAAGADRFGWSRKEMYPMAHDRATPYLISLGLLCVAGLVFGQTGQNPGGQQPTGLRSTTRFVVVNVIVKDKQGAPVKGLTRGDFTVLDGGQKQEISSFSVESGRPPQGSLEPLPPNTFSNHVRREGGVPTSVAVILFDQLNTQFEDLGWARRQLIKFLSQLQPQDRVALYVLGHELRVVQDFTSDPGPLLEALRHLAGAPGAPPAAGGLNQPPASDITGLSGPAADAATLLESGLADWTREGQQLARDLGTAAAIEAIANHLSGMPGRKSLIWVTGRVPSYSFSGKGLPHADPRLTEAYERMVQALNDADVAIYPVDARGLFADPNFKAENADRPRVESGETGRALAQMNLEISGMIYYAQQTGGRAFYNTNDLKGSLRSALDDSDLTYTLGYYPSGVAWDGRYRPIKVLVDRRGVQVRHRQGYLATAAAPPENTDRRALLQQAAASPLDSNALGLTATLTPFDNSGGNKFQLTVKIDPSGVTFRPANGADNVLMDVFAGQYSRPGDSMGGVIQTISLGRIDKRYEEVKREGLSLTFPVSVEFGAEEFRVVARDAPSGAIGSVRIPLRKLSTPFSVPTERATQQMLSRVTIPENPPQVELEPPGPILHLGTSAWVMTGRVASPDNEPLGGVRVWLQLSCGADVGHEVETNSQGRFELPVPDSVFELRAPNGVSGNGKSAESPGELRVWAFKQGYWPAREEVETPADEGLALELVLQDGDRRATLLTPEELIAALARRKAPPEPNVREAIPLYRDGVKESFHQNETLAAIPLLRRALALDPSCVGCEYLLGLAHFGAGGWDLARGYLTEAAGLNDPGETGPKLPEPLIALAVLNIWHGDWESFERLLNTALAAAPGDGLALEELGRLKMFRQDWTGAEETLQKAVRKGAPPEVHLLRAELDLDQGDAKGAQAELRRYLKDSAALATWKSKGNHPGARSNTLSPAARQVEKELSDRMQLDAYGKVETVVTKPLAELVSEIPELKGIEPVQSQEPLASLLHNVGATVEKLISELPDTVSDESVHQERLGPEEQVEASRDRNYQYLILIHPAQGAPPSIKEYRTEQDGKEPGQDYNEVGFFATSRFAFSVPRIFDPMFQSGSDFRLLGRQSVAGHETEVVAFAQIPRKAQLINHHITRYGSVPFLSQGIVWVDVATHQIVWARADLLKPLRMIGLKQETTMVELAETTLAGSPHTFWLPQKVKVFVNSGGHYFRDQHTYSNFRLFRVESTIRAVGEK
jgi:VWFA-related protein